MVEDRYGRPDSAKKAIELYDRDHRFRMIVQSAVSRVMQDHGPIDPEAADQDAYDVSLKAAALVLQMAFEADAELTAARMERDHYKALAEQALALTPLHLPVVALTKEG